LLERDDLMVYCSFGGHPVEMSELRWETVGRAAAKAVRRGAILFYVRPSAAAQEHLRTAGFHGPSEEECRAKFRAFRARVAEVIGDSVATESRVIQCFLDDDAPFYSFAPARSRQCFRYRTYDLLAEQLAVADSPAWDIIDPVRDQKAQVLQFLAMMRGALRRLPWVVPSGSGPAVPEQLARLVNEEHRAPDEPEPVSRVALAYHGVTAVYAGRAAERGETEVIGKAALGFALHEGVSRARPPFLRRVWDHAGAGRVWPD
jgi:hypothetical protein